jgi:hypothetical protein
MIPTKQFEGIAPMDQIKARHHLSRVEGQYVFVVRTVPVNVTTDFGDLWDHLSLLDYDDAAKARVWLVDGDDHDDVTHLIFQDKTEAASNYESWSQVFGENGFMQFWFDEYGSEHSRDYDRRYRAWQDDQAAEKRIAANIAQMSRKAVA